LWKKPFAREHETSFGMHTVQCAHMQGNNSSTREVMKEILPMDVVQLIYKRLQIRVTERMIKMELNASDASS